MFCLHLKSITLLVSMVHSWEQISTIVVPPLTNMTYMNVLTLTCTRVIYIGFMDVLCRFSYQYLGWFSYVFRTIGVTSVMVILLLPYRHLVVILRYMTGFFMMIIVWMLQSFKDSYAIQQTFGTFHLAVLVLTQSLFILTSYHTCKVNSWTRFCVFSYILLILGEILGLGSGWRKDVLIICLIFLLLAVYLSRSQQDFVILTFEEGRQLDIYIRSFRLNSISHALSNREFVVYFILQCLFTALFYIFNHEHLVIKDISTLALGTSCSSILSLISFISTVLAAYEVSVKICYRLISGNYRDSSDVLLFSEYRINIYLFSADLFIYELTPMERGVIVENRFVLLVACLMEACFLIVGVECTEAAVILGNKFITFKVVVIHMMFSVMTSVLIFKVFILYSMNDMGTLLTLSILISLFLRTFISLFNFILCKVDGMQEEFWEKFDDLMFSTHVVSSSLYILVYLLTACFAIWILLYGQYTWLDLFRLLALCQMNIYNSIQNLNNVLYQRQSVNKYTSALEDTCSLSHSDESVCSICLQKMSTAKITPCRHVFHEICIRKWLNSRESWYCPLCKSEFDVG